VIARWLAMLLILVVDLVKFLLFVGLVFGAVALGSLLSRVVAG
jgi:hypothetical protein